MSSGTNESTVRAAPVATDASREAPRAAPSSGAVCRRREPAPRRRRRMRLGRSGRRRLCRAAPPARTVTRPANARCVSGETTTTSGSGASGLAASTTQSTIRRPRIGCRCLGVAERMRVPRPPAMTTAASAVPDAGTVGTLAGAPGFEPGITGPKPVALPLGHAPVNREAESTGTGRRPVSAQRRSSRMAARAAAARRTTRTIASRPMRTIATGTRTTISCDTAATHEAARKVG